MRTAEFQTGRALGQRAVATAVKEAWDERGCTYRSQATPDERRCKGAEKLTGAKKAETKGVRYCPR
jgi:hypothetical protein